ncbi:MAG: PD-(D/E)XK nuclease family protein, partial [Bacteroidota bacterium]
MQTFLQEVIAEVRQKYSDLSNIVFILPSKRAGTFLKQCIASSNTTPSLSPEIHSIESFVEKMACLRPASVSQQLFELYNAYLTSDHPKDKEGFYTFSKWSGTLIQDINEMDRYLIDTQKLFSNLADVQKINHWSPSAEKTEMMEEYLQFWDSLEELYTLFNTALLKKGLGHQGLIYRKAHQKLETYLQENSTCPHVFIGFNALNKAESEIIQTILLNLESHIYWDLDSSFLEDPVHDAGHFIREHFKGWPHFRNNPLKGIQENFRSKKEIQIIGVPTNVTQAKYVGTLLKNLNKNTSTSLTNTAVVLSDEGFLNPLLHALPPEIKAINITMGYPLGKTVMASLFLQLFRLHIQKGEQGWYYQEVLDVLAHPYIKILMRHKGQDLARHLSQKIREKNWTYINVHRLIEKTSIAKNYISTLFLDKTPTPKKFVLQCLKIIALLKTKLQDSRESLSPESWSFVFSSA